MTANEDDTRAVFVYEIPRTGDWFFVLVKHPNLFYSTEICTVEGYFNESTSETFGPFDSRIEALEKINVLLEPDNK